MKTIEIKGTERKDLGKTATIALRKEDNVPCVMYGGKEVVHFYASTPTFKPLVYSPNVYIVKLSVGKKEFKAIMKELQFHPVSDRLLHIDFIEIADDREVEMNIPINVFGNSEGVKKGGKLSLAKRYLKVKALPKNLPDVLDVNVDKLDVGQTIKVGDLKYEGITLLNQDREPVVSILASRVTAKGDATTPAAK
jgi:large subunit ribosomal protein L25